MVMEVGEAYATKRWKWQGGPSYRRRAGGWIDRGGVIDDGWGPIVCTILYCLQSASYESSEIAIDCETTVEFACTASQFRSIVKRRLGLSHATRNGVALMHMSISNTLT